MTYSSGSKPTTPLTVVDLQCRSVVVDRNVVGDTVLELYPGGVRAVAVPSLIERWHVDLPEFDDPDSLEATESAFSVFRQCSPQPTIRAARTTNPVTRCTPGWT